MLDEDDEVTRKLLSDSQINFNMSSAVVMIENEKNNGKGVPFNTEKEPDLRIHTAVSEQNPNLDEIIRLVDEQPNLIYERDEDEGCTALHSLVINASKSVTVPIAKLLVGVKESKDGSQLISIERKDLLNLQDSSNYTALHYAALRRDENLTSALLRWGADPYIQGRDGNTPLHLASMGMEETAVNCGKELLKYDIKNELINMLNSEEKTALHKAIDAKSIIMSNFFLKPENKFKLSQADSKNGWNVLHYICSGTEEDESLCTIAKEIVKRCTEEQLNQSDHKKRSPLHICAIQRLPQITKIIVNEDNANVVKTDELNRMPLHYAALNGLYPKGQQCVDILIGRNFASRKDAIQYLYRSEDAQGQTPANYAILNLPPKSVRRYLSVLPDPHDWLTGTYATLLYKHCPLALPALMEKAFTEEKKRSTDLDDCILVDYGSITGYTDNVKVEPQQETRYLKQALHWDYESKKEVLLSPLVQLFMQRKWHKLRWIILTWVLWQLIWLGAFTTLVITFYSNEESHKSTPAAWAASFVMLIYIASSLVNESFELYTMKTSYILSLTNITQVCQNILALLAISPVLTGADGPQIWQKYATATGILLAYILSMRDIGKLHNKIGLVVEVLKQVLIQIVYVLLCCAPLWVGFTLAFVVIFDNDEILNSSFPGPLVKILVLMTGEFEFNDTFKEDDNTNPMNTHRVVRLLFFLSFLISVPVAFFNLLTGFALVTSWNFLNEDLLAEITANLCRQSHGKSNFIHELRERAKVGRIAKQLEHIHFIESILLSLRPLRKVFGCFPYEDCLRKLNVTTAWIDQKRTFYTTIKEQIRVNERRSLNQRRVEGCLVGFMPSFCQDKVPVDVEEDIFGLATKNSNPDLQVQPKCPSCHKEI